MAVRARQRAEAAVNRAVNRAVSRAVNRYAAAALATLLAACAGRPVPDWQLNSKTAVDRAVAAYLSGDSALADSEWELARSEVARTGRVDLLARVELTACAARVASLQFEGCEGFDRLRSLAGAPERAYADFLSGRLQPQQVELLPEQQRRLAGTGTIADGGRLNGIEDPFSRLVAVAVLFESGRADPSAMSVAVDTASSQGWRRPLLAWLNVLAERADKSGARDEAARLRQRIGLVLESK